MVPIATSILWARTTSYAVIAGVVGGAVAGMSVWLSYASTFPGGLSATTFVKNTGDIINYSLIINFDYPNHISR